MKFNKIVFASICLSLLFISCGDDEVNAGFSTDSFDRKEMLQNWADHIIIPSFESYVNSLVDLKSTNESFLLAPSTESLEVLRSAYINSYLSWQNVAFFDIGKAEEIGLRNFSNIYPTDEEAIIDNIETKNYNLELPSNYDTQGFPALDFLLFGTADSNEGILNFLQRENNSQYLSVLIDRLLKISDEVLEDWKNSYREIFISNDAASEIASVDKLVNDYLLYIEKYLRAGKIGIPAGVFSGNTLPGSVEAPYSAIYSKALCLKAFEAVQDFYSGISFESKLQLNSLESYVDYMIEKNHSEDLSAEIKNQWSYAVNKIDFLSSNFGSQINEDNSKMLEVYDEIQKSVILLKVDMMQVLNIQVDYIDADGD